MFLLAAAALATASPQPATSASAQATATIRIVAAVRLKLDASTNPGAPPTRDARVRTTDGTQLPAKLIEFQ
jgi:hypothetical protein